MLYPSLVPPVDVHSPLHDTVPLFVTNVTSTQSPLDDELSGLAVGLDTGSDDVLDVGVGDGVGSGVGLSSSHPTNRPDPLLPPVPSVQTQPLDAVLLPLPADPLSYQSAF